MEDDNSAKAPVTRLRRRLSVESTEERSSTPNTPTKKRGRPPKLVQIDENDVTPPKSTPKRGTRKTNKDALEPLDDKPLTPVRRSTRIKSNTSIVSDTVATTTSDTPRAKRVTRRNSQIGSDSEIPLTPAKQTRRTRKDSTPKLDQIEKAVPQITEIIAEEAEFVEKSFSTPSHSPSNNKSKKSSGLVIDEGEKKSDISVIDDAKNKSIVKSSSPPSPDIQKENISPGPKHNKKGNLSASTIDLLNNVDKFSKTDTLNKTTSFLESNMKPYKKRTMSWSTNSTTPDETLKQEKINKSQNYNESGVDSLSQNSQNIKNVKVVVDRMDIDQICNNSATENKHQEISSEELFSKNPSEDSKPEIIIEEFTTEINVQTTEKTQDQFVPVVDVSSPNVDVSLHKSKTDKSMNASRREKMFNDSVEPMDVDQTIPESMVMLEEKESFTELNNKSRKSSLSSESKRKPSVSQAMETENKSTLILSQPNDNTSQINSLGKSPMPSDNMFLSKSLVDLDKTQNLDKEAKNQSITCLTSTPLQQKPLQRLIAPMNTSVIKSNDNIDGTPKSFVDTNSPLAKNENIKLSSASKSLKVDDDCDDKVPEDKITNIDQSIKSVTDSQIKDDCKNISMSNKSNVLTPKDKDNENNVSTESIKSKEHKLIVNVHSSDEDSSDDMPNLKSNVNESKSKSKKKMLINDESDDSEISNDESISKNDLVDDEADDAGDDYESGDSQDEEELRYAKENEITDKGVTLTSDEDFSNDSDYEKDSFIVSSDEEDNQLLEGTEDDLSMSDNELKMTAKSKKKYNERMIKEQKKASREMFESRHKLNIKKKNVIEDDTDSKSDDDNPPKQQKKINRMRLDSSHETSGLNESKSRTEIKKHLSESNVNETFNEKEMTQNMNVSSQESDPLATSMKKDPKSPKKGDKRTNTTLDFEVSSNRSQLNNLEKDEENPLESEKDNESSSDSDTNNIISNYDSILSTLNKASKLDTSLNLDVKKKMKNKRASIIDELNLTQSGKKESLSKTTPKQNPNKKDLVEDDDNSSSDSISLKLLISEDSNTDSINTKNEDEAIPSKESEAKIDLTNNEEENMDCGSENLFFIDTKGDLEEDSPAEENIFKDMNISNIKTPKSEKKKQRLSKSQTDINVTLIEEIDHQSTSSAKTPKSDKKKQAFEAMADNDSPIKEIINKQNTSNVNTPKSEKKKKQKLSESTADIEDAPTEDTIQIQNTSSVKTPKSEKKKKQKLSESTDVDDAPAEERIIKDLNISNKTPQSEKKQKLSKSQIAEAPFEDIPDQNTPSDKKKKRLSKSHPDIEAMQAEDRNTSNVKTPKSEKKRQKLSQSHSDIDVEPEDNMDQNASSIKTPKSEKKKKKKKFSESAVDIEVSDLNLSKAKTPKSDKKKKQDFSESQGNIQVSELDSSNAKTPKSAKKKKLSLSESQTNIQELNSSNAKTPKSAEKKKQDLSESQNNQELGSKANTPKSEKKKNRDVSQTNIEVSEAPIEEIFAEMDSNIKTPKSDKKKKRKSGNIEDADVVEEVSVVKTPKSAEKLPQTHIEDLVNKQEIDSIKTKGEKKKKKQMLQSADSFEGQSEDLVMGKKKRKRSNTVPVEEIIETASLSNGNEKKKRKIKNTDETVKVADVKKSKKRKEREDDEHDQPKVQPSSSKMTVPRLPMSVITQLADNPKIQARKKPKVISTSQFIVEDYRRKMPSTYLEESVYLNDDSPEKKKPKKKIPKVLPSMPSTSSSNHGFTTTFKINVISAETKFVAQADNVANFREDRLYNKNRKRRTYEHLKKHTSSKLSKF